ncbi:MAG: recombinase family protein [Alphaproteobacteria bacterium]|nr:recombinase family protein [Alphaproteobacteria bacterium]
MNNPITKTINPREAVLFSCGGVNEVARQFVEMLQYCKRKNLHVVDMFFDTSNINVYQKECFNQMLDYLKHNKIKQAVVFHSRKTYLKYVDISKLLPFMQSGQIELRFAKDNVILG